MHTPDASQGPETVTVGYAPDGVGTGPSGQGRPGKSGGAIENRGPPAITESVLTGDSADAGAHGTGATAVAGLGRLGGISSYFPTAWAATATAQTARPTGLGNPS